MSIKVLAMGVHNDDCDYGIGGTAKLLTDQGCAVYFSYLMSPYHEALAEYQTSDSVRSLGLAGKLHRFIQAKDAILYGEELVEAYSDIVKEVQPDIAFIMWPRDNHIEHEHCAKAQLDALYRSAPQVKEVYAYEVGPLQTMAFFGEPDISVNITDAIEPVKEVLSTFTTSVRGSQALWREKEVSSQWRGHMAYADFDYAEALKMIKLPNGGEDFLLRQLLGDRFRWGGVGSYYWGRHYYFQ